MAENLLVDTDVLIDFLRGRAEATKFLEGLAEPPAVSAITIAELYAGVRDGKERHFLDDLADKLSVVEVDRDIAVQGGLYRRDYFGSHGIGINDAIIAATAESENRTLITLNIKHFPMLTDVVVPYQKT